MEHQKNSDNKEVKDNNTVSVSAGDGKAVEMKTSEVKSGRDGREYRGGHDNRGRDRDRERDDEYVEKLVTLNRTAKVVKGGRRFSFAALTVVGDKKGHVGYGFGKANDVTEAIKKSIDRAKRNLIVMPVKKWDHPA